MKIKRENQNDDVKPSIGRFESISPIVVREGSYQSPSVYPQVSMMLKREV